MGGITMNNIPLRCDCNGIGKEMFVLLCYNGVMGMAVMKRFNMINDYQKDILYLKPNHYSDDKNKKRE